MNEHLLRVDVSCALIHNFICTHVFAFNVLLVCLLRFEVFDERLAKFNIVIALERLDSVELDFLRLNASKFKARQERCVANETHKDDGQHYNLVDLQQLRVPFHHDCGH